MGKALVVVYVDGADRFNSATLLDKRLVDLLPAVFKPDAPEVLPGYLTFTQPLGACQLNKRLRFTTFTFEPLISAHGLRVKPRHQLASIVDAWQEGRISSAGCDIHNIVFGNPNPESFMDRGVRNTNGRAVEPAVRRYLLFYRRPHWLRRG